MKKIVMYITKPPEFDENDEVVLGQCEFHTDNWQLRVLLNHENVTLATGTFYFLDRIMGQIGDVASLDDAKIRVQEISERIKGQDIQPDDKSTPESGMHAVQLLDPDLIQEALDRFKESRGDEPLDENLPLSIETRNGCAIGHIKNTYIVSEINVLVQVLNILAQEDAPVVILDLNEVKNISSRAIHKLIEFHKRMSDENRRFFLAGLRRSVQHILNLMNLDAIIEFFPTVEDAVAEAREVTL